jgi:hypothetical protein
MTEGFSKFIPHPSSLILFLSLTLLVLRICLANHTNDALTGDDLTILTALLYRCLDFHNSYLLLGETQKCEQPRSLTCLLLTIYICTLFGLLKDRTEKAPLLPDRRGEF